MRYFLTFLFFILTSNVYATDPDRLPDDTWMKNFWGGCGYYPIKQHKNNNVFWRFTLEKGDRGGCSSDNMVRHGASYWERKEVEGRKLKSGSTYEIQFKVRFLEGFADDRETFFQVHGFSGDTCKSPLLMFKFGKGFSAESRVMAAVTEHNVVHETTHTKFGPIDKIRGVWHHIKFVFETNVGTSNFSLYVNDKLEVLEEEFYIPACKTPYIKFGIYRPGDPKYGKTSIVDFDDVIVAKVR